MFGKKELQQIIESQLIKKTLKLIEVTDSEDEKDNNELFIFGLLALNEECYLETHTYNSIVKSKHWYNDILPAYDNIRFKKILRILPENFKLLVNLIKNHSVFQSNNSKQQLFVELQFAVFIRRLGSRNDIFSICSNFRIAEGTVILFCKRVMKAIIFHKTSYIK
ncbi:protein ANTAGONIST OF LIKE HETEROCHROMATIN PROTEIN 1-like [Rhizophagus irregularis DAOM 181602=DAOM 197198]|nr:protein ANTAGONIST OF LIKE HETEROCHROMATIN PROTEIN 1-like [Rhizophagus irregularis DAOM 181602=DAOM 197198]